MAGLADLSSVKAVEQAMAEFNKIGRDAFLEKYQFGKARAYYLVHGGKRYDSKAIAGAAIGYQFPKHGPLKGRDFVGGRNTVMAKLESLGFTVVIED